MNEGRDRDLDTHRQPMAYDWFHGSTCLLALSFLLRLKKNETNKAQRSFLTGLRLWQPGYMARVTCRVS